MALCHPGLDPGSALDEIADAKWQNLWHPQPIQFCQERVPVHDLDSPTP